MHIEKYAFSNENGLVWRDENKMKTLVWVTNILFRFL